jgi:hypothetical protein
MKTLGGCSPRSFGFAPRSGNTGRVPSATPRTARRPHCGATVTGITPATGHLWLGCHAPECKAIQMDFLGKAKGLLTGLGQPPAPLEKAAPKKNGTSYHAVAIDPGHHCCVLARTLAKRRFLSSKAPPLPLKGCMNAECTCRYVHFADRRAGPRRARDMGVCVDGYVETDRRDKPFRGRRESDAVASTPDRKRGGRS